MPDFKTHEHYDRSLRLERLDNGMMRFFICNEPGAQVVASVDLPGPYALDIAKMIMRKLAEPLDRPSHP